jgi:hypothetical protein
LGLKKKKLENKIKKIISKKDKKNDEYNFLLKKIKKLENKLEVLENKFLKDIELNSINDEKINKDELEVEEEVVLDNKNIDLEIVEEKKDDEIQSTSDEEGVISNKNINNVNDFIFTPEEVDVYKKCMYENLLEDNISIGVAKISKLTQISLTKARAIKKYLQEEKVIDTIGKTKTKVIKFE